jgi:hypothetical protein
MLFQASYYSTSVICTLFTGQPVRWVLLFRIFYEYFWFFYKSAVGQFFHYCCISIFQVFIVVPRFLLHRILEQFLKKSVNSPLNSEKSNKRCTKFKLIRLKYSWLPLRLLEKFQFPKSSSSEKRGLLLSFKNLFYSSKKCAQ